MRGNRIGWPVQPPSVSSAPAAGAPAFVAPVTDFEYQARRVLTSVLLILVARHRINTSPAPGLGTGTSVRKCSWSSSPWPKSKAADIFSGSTPPTAVLDLVR